MKKGMRASNRIVEDAIDKIQNKHFRVATACSQCATKRMMGMETFDCSSESCLTLNTVCSLAKQGYICDFLPRKDEEDSDVVLLTSANECKEGWFLICRNDEKFMLTKNTTEFCEFNYENATEMSLEEFCQKVGWSI